MVNAKTQHDCKTELNDVNLRATPARMALMKLFETSDKPLDVQSMIEFLDEKDIQTDPATVFRIINLFTEKGLTKQIHLNEGKFRYELANKENHHHLVCEKCKTIEKIKCSLTEIDQEIKEKKQFTVKHHSLEFYGICKNCTD